MAAPAGRVRILPALHRELRGQRQGGEEVRRPEILPPARGAVRFGGPARARLPQDDPPSHLRQVHVAQVLHPQGHLQRLLQVRLRDGTSQRHRGAARNTGIHHQRIRHPPQEGAPAVLGQGAHPPPQAQVRGTVPSAALVLHHPIRGEGRRHRHAHPQRILQVLAMVLLREAGPLPQRARGNPRASRGRPAQPDQQDALHEPGPVPRLGSLPGRRTRALPLEQRAPRQQRLPLPSERADRPPHHLRPALQEQLGALERDGRGTGPERIEDVHGVRPGTLRSVHDRVLQGGGGGEEEDSGHRRSLAGDREDGDCQQEPEDDCGRMNAMNEMNEILWRR
mmetsp:Transcript_15534/g.37260  ORF Transcript_15534/g.37260 Transcript_15534/m.37260 type:complete len:337 (-) Transcript_15534:182-1192(-)